MCSLEDIRSRYGLHLRVWQNDYRELEAEIRKHHIEEVDPRGRTALHLAISLGHLECATVLLRNNASVTKENAKGWTVLQEAISTGDPDLVMMVLQYRDYDRVNSQLNGVPELLSKIQKASDFYVEMKWEFTSWIPLVSKMCPSDVYRVWKSGANLRVDTTLLNFDNMRWERGRRSYMFKGEAGWAEFVEVDHDNQVVNREHFELSQEREGLTLTSVRPTEDQVASRLTTPIVCTALDTKNISFERNKSGFWGWRTDKTEVVQEYEAKVFTVNNVNVVTRSRTEHLTEEEKAKYKDNRNPLESLLGIAEEHIGPQNGVVTETATVNNPTSITPEEYFDPEFELGNRDIGRPTELCIKSRKFKATLWLCEDYPLSLTEQVIPIINLMARSSAHFAKLRDFITLQFPPGFPVKIEIPLFHVLNARITFGNVNTCRTVEAASPTPKSSQAESTTSASEDSKFEVDQSVFDIPASYHVRGGSRTSALRDEDDQLVQFAIQQSLLESHQGEGDLSPTATSQSEDNFDLWASRPVNGSPGTAIPSTSSYDTQLRLAMDLSAREEHEQEQRRLQEEAELERILQLSLTEK
ncbi:ankyrin repeat domain-containing protein 13A [Callorhinchus milii]|uniref:Ankyrin repeat domain 13A n=1 Tax=Callorhinchus milii TaxID=7868 RepID=A0A4W3JHP8_CALMI|nr:ankyrin repeat domain-containing protein 13A [Callorhinchus milii]|eukprot:gi/632967564/ref/XP_007900047.1/ PREDICTED: ankyrin repeat domain-containing protein 13A [Callorhinchus milii]